MGLNDILHNAEVELPFVGLGPAGAVGSVDEVAGDIVSDEGFGKTEGRSLVLSLLDDADIVGSFDQLGD